MDNLWTPHALAEEVLRVVPNLRRWLASSLREVGEEEHKLLHIGVLIQLQAHPITTSELAKRQHVSLQAASSLMQGLVERGWVQRVSDPNDRRQWQLQITPEGIALANAAKQQIVALLTDFFAELTPDEMAAAQQFMPALGRVMTRRYMPDALK
jgi:DNA-binding MarR family transcriptional regulator